MDKQHLKRQEVKRGHFKQAPELQLGRNLEQDMRRPRHMLGRKCPEYMKSLYVVLENLDFFIITTGIY